MEISTASIKKTASRILHRYHVVIFVVVVLGGLAVIVLLLNDIITQSGSTGVPANNQSSTFDQATIDRIEDLKTRDEPAAQPNLSNGRSNPFVE